MSTKSIVAVVSLLLVVATGLIVYRFQTTKTAESNADTASAGNVPVPEVANSFTSIPQEVIEGKAVLLDVRTPDEYAAGHIEGATNFDSVDIMEGKTPNISKDAKIYLYCRSGNRSSQSAAKLKSAGFTNVIDLGAMSSIEAAGGRVVR